LNRFCLGLFKSLFRNKIDGAGGPELAVQVGVSAFNAFIAKKNIVLHTDIAGFTVGVMDTFAHV
jgi:hypothetical protein